MPQGSPDIRYPRTAYGESCRIATDCGDLPCPTLRGTMKGGMALTTLCWFALERTV